VYVLLRQDAQPTDCLKAAFSAHVLLHILDSAEAESSAAACGATGPSAPPPARAVAGGKGGSGGKGTSGAGGGAGSSAVLVADTVRRLAGSCLVVQQDGGGGGSGSAGTSSSGSSIKRPTYTVDSNRLLDASKAAVDVIYPDFIKQVRRASHRGCTYHSLSRAPGWPAISRPLAGPTGARAVQRRG
jgi:hypothetical protein